MTTQVNTFELNKKSIKAKNIHTDSIRVGGGWKKYVPTIGNGGAMGTGANLTCDEWRYKVENGTCTINFNLQKAGPTTNEASGTGVYTFTYPPGCVPKFTGLAGQKYTGSAVLVGATKTFRACMSLGTASFSIFLQTAATTGAAYASTSDAEIGMSGAALNIGGTFEFELTSTCAAYTSEST